MRTLTKNKQQLKYSLRQERQPVYEVDEDGNKIIDYIDEDGNIYYRETGSYNSEWSKPEDFLANISESGGEAEAQEFGLSVSDYDAVIVAQIGEFPLVLGSLIWKNSPVLYKDEENTELDEKSADFAVLKVSESISFVKYVLKAVVK